MIAHHPYNLTSRTNNCCSRSTKNIEWESSASFYLLILELERVSTLLQSHTSIKDCTIILVSSSFPSWLFTQCTFWEYGILHLTNLWCICILVLCRYHWLHNNNNNTTDTPIQICVCNDLILVVICIRFGWEAWNRYLMYHSVQCFSQALFCSWSAIVGIFYSVEFSSFSQSHNSFYHT